ncbi:MULTISPECIES: aminoglycoside 6'-N-acetyltransferase [unclassified Burkholderia]|uniref:aminoglycoside 6'-N-acetyltransferase n=1 Tax=unclassified Burkholderia TaxID=2613784 RepID=UPI00075623A3|nr:aminoglycoside 6'-acetyltransferase [Burkholderia sp. RF2-non_BP3]KUY78592.1 aminoglycoside 6'-acetyltransferase [Burkholderia sp. RF4-BP95]KUY95216.1 aminoglycoside 6'-acetyltransferase [Burkholderia sp. RF7-non_BP4]KUY98902.1 aminoglycoside 6'-acetyltransferase [Burkholderia sp. RF7-non_BP1]
MPSVSFTVRAVLPHDIGAWCSLRRLLWQHVSDDEHILETQRLLADQHRYATFIAFSSDSAPIGFAEAAVHHDYVNGCKTSPVLFLEGIYVMPNVRRVGIAKALCAAIGQWGSAHDCTEFASDTQVDNVRAQALHCALGFEETERVVFFRKRLTC